MPFSPTEEQLQLIFRLSDFVAGRGPGDVFVLSGFAGTGKTSVIGALVKALDNFKIKNFILAPTGRAAKVAAKLSSGKASTIHKRIFRGNSTDPSNTTFFLAENRDHNSIFIVDEASMLTDGDSFSSSLLLQLVRHIYSAPGCNMIIVGDLAQLPPVGRELSPAMDPARLRQIGLTPVMSNLSLPARQNSDSGILYNATVIRHFLFSDLAIEDFSIYSSGFPDVCVVDPSEMLDSLSSSYAGVGKDETIVITRSNYRANNINATIRRHILEAESPLISGERLVVSKNDYYWSKINRLDNFIANGEIAMVCSVGKKSKKYGRWFADVELIIPGVENPVQTKIMMRSLVSEGPSVPREEMERFYNRVIAESEGETSERIKAALESPFYNALQVKYGYCLTCHKAQGGQWKHVYIDLGGLADDFSKSDFFRWLYTAVTRASEKVFFLNPPFDVE